MLRPRTRSSGGDVCFPDQVRENIPTRRLIDPRADPSVSRTVRCLEESELIDEQILPVDFREDGDRRTAAKQFERCNGPSTCTKCRVTPGHLFLDAIKFTALRAQPSQRIAFSRRLHESLRQVNDIVDASALPKLHSSHPGKTAVPRETPPEWCARAHCRLFLHSRSLRLL